MSVDSDDVVACPGSKIRICFSTSIKTKVCGIIQWEQASSINTIDPFLGVLQEIGIQWSLRIKDTLGPI